MAKPKMSYETIAKTADMSASEYKKEHSNLLSKMSDETAQGIIDAAKDTISASEESRSNWNTLMNNAKKAYDDMYKGSLKYLEITANVTEDQWDAAYQASVSDNYADGTKLDGTALENVTIDGGDGTDVDWSETQTMKKTKLADGQFRTTYPDGEAFDDFTGDEVGATKDVAGGTITYLGVAEYNIGEVVDVDDKDLFHTKDYVPVNDTQRGTIVHYEGYLGSFDYNTRDFEIAYYETEVNGNKISVPTLHYIGDQGVDIIDFSSSKVGITDGSKINIPDGLIVGDYMFAGNQSITSMPELPDTIESAHGMFMNCTGMTEACNKSLDSDGNIKMPSKLKDISWMFAGCTQMTHSFGDLGYEMLDARYAFADCKKLGYVASNGADGEMNNTFSVPDMTHLRYANEEYLRNMFDNSNPKVESKITDYIKKHGELGSSYTLPDGTHSNDYDKLVDSSYDKDTELLIAEEASRQQILQMIDKNAKGTSGLAADTNGLASSAIRITDDGTFADDSTWAKFLQDDFTGTYHQDNQFGEILDHAIPAVGTYAVSKSILNQMTGHKHKALTTIGAVALAAVPQIVGFGNTLTPMLDWTANAVGPDTKVGKFLTNISDKLKGINVNYSTTVEELNADTTFEAMQSSAVNYAATQLSKPFQTLTVDVDGDGEKESVITAASFEATTAMAENGKKIANDANLLFIACEPEANLKNTMSDGIMKTTVDALRTKMDAEISAANGDKEKLEQIRETYSTYYSAMLYNLNAYDDAAVEEIGNKYMNSPELKEQAMNGLEKVMRTTVTPLYDEMKALQSEWQEKYGMDFFSDKQLNDSANKLSLKTMDITGLGKFSDYDPNKDYSDQSDVYVEKLETYQKALVEAVDNATSQEEIDTAYASYYESAYGWALDEAEAHGVVLDKRGAQTSAEKDSFAEYVAKVEAEAQNSFKTETENATPNESVPEPEPESGTKSEIENIGTNTNTGDVKSETEPESKPESESESEKAARRAAMVGVEDTDTTEAEKVAMEVLN